MLSKCTNQEQFFSLLLEIDKKIYVSRKSALRYVDKSMSKIFIFVKLSL